MKSAPEIIGFDFKHAVQRIAERLVKILVFLSARLPEKRVQIVVFVVDDYAAIDS